MITHIKLENFKRVVKFETDLDEINILVGTNNSGKSSVLQGIQFSIMAEVARRVSGMKTVSQDKLLYLPSQNFSVLRHDSPYTNVSGATSTLTLDRGSEVGDLKESLQITISKGRNFGNISIESNGSPRLKSQINSNKELYSAYTPGLAGIPLNEKLVAPAVLQNAAANGDANLYLRNIIYYVNKINELPRLNNLINKVFPGYSLTVPYDPDTDIYISVNIEFEGKEFPLELGGTGLLQVVQIMAYAVYFKPKLMLLDEPDEHLHPSNQVLLCDGIKLLVNQMNLQVILSTHSRHMISALDGDARFIWMKSGEVCTDDKSPYFYNIQLDLGALDAYDSILSGQYKNVILTEDSDTKYLKKILEASGCVMPQTLVIPYSSCSRLDSAIQLANFIRSSAKTCKIIIHRDRDFMTDEEISVVKKRFENEKLPLWITDECDIEAYFTTFEHISEVTGKTIDEVSQWQSDIIQEESVEIQHSFETKRTEIRNLMYLNGKLKGWDGDSAIDCPNTLSLFGKTSPTSRKNVVGKFLLKECRSRIIELADKQIDFLKITKALYVESLAELLAN